MAISVVDGKFYVFGGTEEGVNTRIESYVNEVYDPDTDSWTTATEVPQDGILGYLMTSAVVDREVYCIKSNTWIASPKQMIFYDPETDSWGTKATPPLNQSCPAAAATTGVNAPAQIYVFDARANQVYDPRTGSWAAGAGMITPRDRVSIAVVEDALYVIGGIVGVPSDYSISVPAYPSSLNELYLPLEYSASPNQKSLPITWIATFVAVAAVIAGVVLLFYFKKRKQ